MNTIKSTWPFVRTSMTLALLLGGVGFPHAARGVTSETQAVLDHPGFREGLIWIGPVEPSAGESASLQNIVTHLDDPAWTNAVEGFLQSYPASPWAASLSHDYASFCRRTGRITKALVYWEAGWALARTNSDDSAHRVGGMILANWTELLSSLGRVDKLSELTAAGQQWPFVNPQDRQKFQGARSCYRQMLAYPGSAFRCGTLAIKAVGQSLRPQNTSLEDLVSVPSPTNGFSVAQLLTLAGQRGLGLVAVRRPWGTQLVVPAVVHWQQNHYAAILEQKDGLYRVSDPTFGTVAWLTADAINEEASGVFLVTPNSVPEGWTQLDASETESIRGRGVRNNVNDGPDKGCPPGKKCPPCKGMPVFWVSEPWINLWISDQPISYLTSRGEPFTFRVTYKQRDTRPQPSLTNNTSFVWNTGWNNSWASYLHLEYTPGNPSTNLSTTLYLPDGGAVEFGPTPNSSYFEIYDPETRAKLQPVSPGSIPGHLANPINDNGINGFRVTRADGSQDIYGSSLNGIAPYGDLPYQDFLLTRHIDQHGNTTQIAYEIFPSGTGRYRVKYVTDYDGRTNTLSYDANSRLSGVTNTYGLSASFSYDAGGNLLSLIDAGGLASTLKYDTNGYPTNLITLYGTNQFEYGFIIPGGDGNFGGLDVIDRSVRATEPASTTSLYLYRYGSPFMPTNYLAGDVPTNTPLGTLDDGTTGPDNLSSVGFRNSFYWGPQQYASLSTTDLASLTTNDYLRGRMRHWLQDTNELYVTSLLSVERDPSPDGTVEGLKTFYDYQGKIYPHIEGTNALPSVTAWRLPGGETHYEYLRFDEWGNTTNQVTTYSRTDGSLGTRTNQFIYAENTFTNTLIQVSNGSSHPETNFTIPNLLARIVGPDGSNLWTFGGFDTVFWTNDFKFAGDTNRMVLSSQRVLPRYLTNGVGDLTQLTFTGFNKISSVKWPSGLTSTNLYAANGFLSQTIDLEIGRTNSFAYSANGLISTFTNELGLALTPAWDGLLRLTKAAFPDGSYVSNRYDKLDITGRRDRTGNWTYFGFDGLDHLTSITNANNAATHYIWCGCGTLETISNALGQATTLTHDNQSRCTAIQFPDTSSASYQYDLAGRITLAQDGAGRPLTYLYNNQGLLTTVSNAYGRLESIVYDVRDRPIQITDANNVTVTNQYDNLDRLLIRSWPGGGTERFGYTTNGLIAYTNQDNQVTRYARDAAGRLTGVINANLETNLFGYNSTGQITNLVDGLYHTTLWHRNEFGWVTNKMDALSREIFRFAYDLNGRATNRWTPEFGNTAYIRDPLGNVTNIVYPLSAIGYSYDALNQLTNMVDAVGTTKFGYTSGGQLQSEDGPWSNDTITYAYTQRLRTSMSLNSQATTYSYDSAWRLTMLSSPAGSFDYQYPTSGIQYPSRITLPNLASITNHYDQLERLDYTALINQWGHVLDGYSYTHDPLGLRTNIVRDFGLTTSSVAIGYDAIGQLTSLSAKEQIGSLRQNEQLGFNFDASDNLHFRTNGALVQTFTVDPLNQLTNITRTGTLVVSGNTPAPATNVTVNGSSAERYGDFTFARTNSALIDGNNTFSNIARSTNSLSVTNTLTVNLPQNIAFKLDSNGNLTNDSSRSFSFDAENQLTNITVAGQWKTEFVYDGLGRRRIERDYTWSGSWVNTNEMRLLYDGLLLVQERDTNNVVRITYTRGLDFSAKLARAGGIGGLLALTDGSGVSSFYHTDGEGNVTALLDLGGNVVARYLYDPFGRSIGQWGVLASFNRMRFSSMPRYGASGLVSYPFRDYDPTLQRWITKDRGGERSGINLYGFVYNNPLYYFDPNGRWAVPGLAPPQSLIAAAEALMAGGAAMGPGEIAALGTAGLVGTLGVAAMISGMANVEPSPTLYPNVGGGNPIPSSVEMQLGALLGPGESRDPDGTIRDAAGNPVRDKFGRPCPGKRTPKENGKARNQFKNNKDAAREGWERRTGQTWPVDENGNPWPAHHPTPLSSGGDPMFVEPQDPNGPDPHNVVGPDGLTDYQRWGALGPAARNAKN